MIESCCFVWNLAEGFCSGPAEVATNSKRVEMDKVRQGLADRRTVYLIFTWAVQFGRGEDVSVNELAAAPCALNPASRDCLPVLQTGSGVVAHMIYFPASRHPLPCPQAAAKSKPWKLLETARCPRGARAAFYNCTALWHAAALICAAAELFELLANGACGSMKPSMLPPACP